jgi:hypothetical protein
MDFVQNFEIFKNSQKLIYGTIFVTDPEYGLTTKKYGVSVNFCRKLMIFAKTVGPPIDFERKMHFLKIHKNSHIGPLCVTDPEFGHNDEEIRSFD